MKLTREELICKLNELANYTPEYQNWFLLAAEEIADLVDELELAEGANEGAKEELELAERVMGLVWERMDQARVGLGAALEGLDQARVGLDAALGGLEQVQEAMDRAKKKLLLES